MTGRAIISTVILAGVTLLPDGSLAQNSEQAPAARFKSSVDVVSVAAVVRDRKGRFVRDLSRDDFQIVESGRPKTILDFRRQADGPVKLALLVDVSGSMRVGDKAVDAKQAAEHVFSGMRAGDQAAVFTFDSALRQVLDFTADRGKLEAALDSVEKPFGQTSLYDAVAETARAVVDHGRAGTKLPHRTAVVVLTDGVDTRSRLSPAQVTSIASSIDVPVYILAVLSMVDDPRESERLKTEAETDLEALAQRTGGELFVATAPAHASVAARQILGELRHQYLLAFEASALPGWRPLEVRARDGGLVVRARSGYTAGE
jgi:Ca-activated chloride channel family protein